MKIRYIALALLAFLMFAITCTAAHAQMSSEVYYWASIIDQYGIEVSSDIVVDVYAVDGSTMIYSDRAGSNQISNRFTIMEREDNPIGFYGKRGDYVFEVTRLTDNSMVRRTISPTDHRIHLPTEVELKGFTVITDTNTVPSSGGQIALDSEYGLFLSTAAGGSWFEITVSTEAGDLQ